MAITYKKLWHILIDKNMKKKDLQKAVALTGYAMRKLGNDEPVTTDVIAKVCSCLNCTPDDVMEITQDSIIEK